MDITVIDKMNLKIKSYTIPIIISLLGGIFMLSCIDENIPAENNGGTSPTDDGYGLGVIMNLQSMTRADEDGIADFIIYEDYIDPAKISLLFFYKGGENADRLIKQFKPNELSVIPIQSSIDGTTQSWYVRIPEDIIDAEFAKTLRENDFKVAATANWESFTLDPEDPIKKLHHLVEDGTYNKDAFRFLYDGYGINMGMHTSWVKNIYNKAHFADEEGAARSAEWEIRNNWWEHIDLNKEKYGDLWLIWNFDAAYRTKSLNEPITNGFIFEEDNGRGKSESQWAKKNFIDLHEWINENSTSLGNFKVGTRETLTHEDNSETREIFKPNDNACFEYVGEASVYKGDNLVGTKNMYGVKLKSVEKKNDSKPKLPTKNYFKFKLVSSATINIKYGTTDTSQDAVVQLQRRNYEDDNDPKDNDADLKLTTSEKFATTPIVNKDSKWNFNVTGDSEYIFIFSENDNTVIYEIEYIASDYLYNIEREGIVLGEGSGKNLIPMYGIQSYNQLGSVWQEGTLFNLSNYNHISTSQNDGYTHKEISMLRSVAKVELKLPRNFNAHNVYLRSMNRRSRNEPMDVSTPTDQIWRDDDIQTLIAQHPTYCEWSQLNINGISPFYGAADNLSYQQKLAWYYGSWAEEGKLGAIIVPTTPLIKYDRETSGYPRIINPRIERSDFTKFYYTGVAEGIYDRYILYVPEKFVDDPNEAGRLESIPKVCHIEFRRGKDDDEQGLGSADPAVNIDDNNCYRIYFTDNGFYNKGNGYPTFDKPEGSDTYDNWENSYEKDPEILRHHWPIMRNHVYSFIVDDASQNVLIVNLKVLPWRNIDENIYNW